MKDIGDASLSSSRRGFMGLVAKLGIGAVAVAAGLVATSEDAWAGNAACCNLRFPPGDPNYCRGNGSGGFICPSPGKWFSWCCCSGSGAFRRTYNCAECEGSGATSCFSGPFICSAYWTSAPNTCVSGCIGSAPVMDAADLARWNSQPWGPPVTAHEIQYSASLAHAYVDPKVRT